MVLHTIEPPRPILPMYHLAIRVMRDNQDAREQGQVVPFNSYQTSKYVHLGTVNCVVCLVKYGQQWGIIDRSTDLAQPVFVPDEEVDQDIQ